MTRATRGCAPDKPSTPRLSRHTQACWHSRILDLSHNLLQPLQHSGQSVRVCVCACGVHCQQVRAYDASRREHQRHHPKHHNGPHRRLSLACALRAQDLCSGNFAEGSAAHTSCCPISLLLVVLVQVNLLLPLEWSRAAPIHVPCPCTLLPQECSRAAPMHITLPPAPRWREHALRPHPPRVCVVPARGPRDNGAIFKRALNWQGRSGPPRRFAIQREVAQDRATCSTYQPVTR
jgi:hypothetical protein